MPFAIRNKPVSIEPYYGGPNWRRSPRQQPRLCRFVAVGGLLAGLLGADAKSKAPWPVWRDSTTQPVKFAPLSKRKAAKLYHEARRFERTTRQPGRQDGALGRNGLAVLHSLLFDFLNYATGALWPSKAEIARRACISERSAARGLDRLRDAGVVNWVRRCIEEFTDGRFSLKQISNAYAVLPASQWRGHVMPPEAPPPEGDTWGATPPLPDVVTMACHERAAGGGNAAMLAALELDPTDELARRLARLGRSIERRESLGFTGLPA